MILKEKPKKCILLLLDGLGDRSYKQLGDKTPLQAAKTPVLDYISAQGANGLYHAGIPGQAMPSETAHFSMFGYDMSDFPGRGALEALGTGIQLACEDVAVLAHFMNVKEQDGYLRLGKDMPAGSETEARKLAAAVSSFETKGVKINFHQTNGFFGIITLHGSVSPFITDTDPVTAGSLLSEVKPWKKYADNQCTQKTALSLKSYLLWVYHKLQTHQINESRIKKNVLPLTALVTQRAGQLKPVLSFYKHCGLKGISIASGIVYKGLSKYIGMDFQDCIDTGNPGDDLASRLEAALALADDYDFIHVHTKTPDQAGHSKNPFAKKSVIESLDKGIGQSIYGILNREDIILIITADHSTPSSGPLIHSGEPVPITITGRGVRHDRVENFDEISAGTGVLGMIRGKELMYIILDYLNRSRLQGLMDTPEEKIFWPADYEPFKLE